MIKPYVVAGNVARLWSWYVGSRRPSGRKQEGCWGVTFQAGGSVSTVSGQASLGVACLFAMSCGELPSLKILAKSDVFSQEPVKLNQLDVLFVVDNSGSMSEEQANLSQSFDRFIQDIEAQNLDFQIGIISTDVSSDNAVFGNPSKSWWAEKYAGFDHDKAGSLLAKSGNPKIITPDLPDYKELFRQNVLLGTVGSGAEAGIWSAMMALSSDRLAVGAWNESFIRDEAYLSVVFLSDEDEGFGRISELPSPDGGLQSSSYLKQHQSTFDQRTSDFVAQLKALKPSREDQISVHAIVAPSPEECPSVYNNGGVSGVGTAYIAVAQAFDGFVANVCEDFADDLQTIGSSIATMINRFKLNQAPNGKMAVYVNGHRIPEDPLDGWTYDAINNEIVFHGIAVPATGASVEVIYIPTAPKSQ